MRQGGDRECVHAREEVVGAFHLDAAVGEVEGHNGGDRIVARDGVGQGAVAGRLCRPCVPGNGVFLVVHLCLFSGDRWRGHGGWWVASILDGQVDVELQGRCDGDAKR